MFGDNEWKDKVISAMKRIKKTIGIFPSEEKALEKIIENQEECKKRLQTRKDELIKNSICDVDEEIEGYEKQLKEIEETGFEIKNFNIMNKHDDTPINMWIENIVRDAGATLEKSVGAVVEVLDNDYCGSVSRSYGNEKYAICKYESTKRKREERETPKSFWKVVSFYYYNTSSSESEYESE
jgi:hypothetical protein